MKVKTSELKDRALDWAVAKCKGEDYRPAATTNGIGMEFPASSYSTDWAQGGPIIEREMREFGFDLWSGAHTGGKFAATYSRGAPDAYVYGPTPLIAAMRCYVASELGAEVDIPEELLT